jgi:hypothetical protein
MDTERATALHRYFLAAKEDVAAPERPFDLKERLDILRDLKRHGVTYDETDAMLALAGHPFTSDWARERYEVAG